MLITNTLSEKLAAAHKRNLAQTTAPQPTEAQRLTAAQIAYRAGVKELQPVVERIEALERQLLELHCDVHDSEESNQKEFERRYQKMVAAKKKV
jgi:hypothetical protein